MMMFSRSLLVKSTGQAAAAVVTAVLLSIAVATVPARGQSEVRVLVNDDPITSYDISTRAQMLRVFSRGTQGDKEAVEQLIDERLMLQEAARLRMVVSDAEVDEEFADRAKKAGTTPEVFGQAMRQAGVDPETFRAFLRANKLSNRVFDIYESIVDACCDAWIALTKAPERIRSIATRPWAKVNV